MKLFKEASKLGSFNTSKFAFPYVSYNELTSSFSTNKE